MIFRSISLNFKKRKGEQGSAPLSVSGINYLRTLNLIVPVMSTFVLVKLNLAM